MHKKRSRCMLALMAGMLFCSVGCSASSTSEQSEKTTVTELPPLVTTDDTTQTSPSETTTQTSTEAAEPSYTAKLSVWEFPEEISAVQMVRYYADDVYLLCTTQDMETQQSQNSLYRVTIAEEPIYTQLFSNPSTADLLGMMDFDILSDGSICVLLCENSGEIPYEDDSFDAESFDWDTYYENYATQYRLAWYDENGRITRQLGLSTLLSLDQTERQTMAFTGIRCDASDHIYLTATIDEQEYLMALDENENLCTVQGSGSTLLSLDSSYQWIRCGESGMLLWEEDADNTMQLYHVIITDNALWKTQIQAAEELTDDAVLAEETQDNGYYGIWNMKGIYCVSEKGTASELLYSWDDLGLSAQDVAEVLLLPECKALLTTYTAQGDLQISLVMPEDYETTTEAITEGNEENTPPSEKSAVSEETTPAVATPTTTMTTQ